MADYRSGWITLPSSDGGADFVGRFDVGDGFARARLVVLGQAKCETGVTRGLHLARTVARPRRGWLGVFVTTGYFSEAAEREVLDDQYPLVLIHGLRDRGDQFPNGRQLGTEWLSQIRAALDRNRLDTHG